MKTMSRLAELKAGDPIMVSLYGKNAEPATVTSVARKYLTTAGYQFDRTTGQLKGQYTGRAWTMEEFEEAEMLRAVKRDLDRLGVEVWRASITLEQAIAILAIVKEER